MFNQESNKQRFIDVTLAWQNTADNYKAKEKDAKTVNIDGYIHSVDNINIIIDYTPHEKEIAELLSKTTGKLVIMQPKISGKHLGKPWPDYIINNQRWELKELHAGRSKELLRNIVHKSIKQADNFVFDITSSILPENEIMLQAEALFEHYNTKRIKTVMIIKNGEIKRVLINQKESLPDPQVEKRQTL